MKRVKAILFAIWLFAFALSACSARPTQVQPTPTHGLESGHGIAPDQTVESILTPSLENLPRSEAEVPRVSVEEAKAALESGTAIIVDVRSPGAYETSHIKGAVSVPLGELERNLSGLTLPKDQWIITYCT